MKTNKFNILKLLVTTVVALVMLLFACTAFAAVDPLYIGVGARPLGMGKAYVAVAEDGDTVFVNPAGLGRITDPKLTSMYTELMGDIRYVVLGGVYPYLPIGTLGGGIVSTNVSDIALYDDGGNPIGKADYANNVLFLSYGLDLGKTPELGVVSEYGQNVQIGASLKYFSQGGTGDGSIEAGTGSGFDMDIGLLYTPLPWLSLGYTQTNLLPTTVSFPESGIEEGISSIAKLGTKITIIGRDGLLTYDAVYGSGYQKLNLAIDYDMATDNPVPGAAHIGLEYYPLKYLALRLGLDQDPGADGAVSNLTAGVGLRYDGIEFNYAYHPYDGIAENATHFFSISYVGPEEEEEPKKEIELALEEPVDKTITREDKIEAWGSILNYVPGTSLEVGGVELEVDERGDFATTLKLKGFGKKLIRATAIDPDANVAETESRVLRLVSFSDVAGEYWARAPIEYSGTAGLVEGYPDGTFKPERALSRAELATLLVRARGVELPRVVIRVFSDLPKTHWAARYIAAAVQMGLVKGYPDGTFRPNNKINRAEGVLVLARFEGLAEPEDLEVTPFIDVPIKHWAAGMISAAEDAQFLDYIRGKYFGPREEFLRSEAVYILAKTTFARKKIDWLLDWEVGFEEGEEMEPEAELRAFKDVPERYWAARPIQELATVGIISGYPDGTFKPERTLSRAELAALLVKARGVELPVVTWTIFSDLPKTHWAARYIKAAVVLGLVQGYPDGSFKPGKSVSRAEAITVIDRFDGIEVPGVIYERPFLDVPANHWSARFVTAGKNAGILEYLEGKNFEPNKGVTRAEAAEMVSKTKFGKGQIEELYERPTAKYKIMYSYRGTDQEEEIIIVEEPIE